MDLPLVSVIVPTYLREETLCNTLACLIEQDYPKFQILVVDQTINHTSETNLYLETLSITGKIIWFRVDFASLPGARNYAIRRAKGEIILFVDDDVDIQNGFISAHVSVFLDKPDVGVVAGRVLDPVVTVDEQENFTVDYLPAEAMDPGIAWYYLDFKHVIKPQEVISARGCNMSFRKEVFSKYGLRFDERMRGSAIREESDLCLRVRHTGYKVWYAPSASLVHFGEPTGGCHDISTQSLKYQITHYHNHFWMAFKNLNFSQNFRLYIRLFDCQVLGNPPCLKDKSVGKILVRSCFYCWGFMSALSTLIQSYWSDDQIYTYRDK